MTGPNGPCLLAQVRAGKADWPAAVKLDVHPHRPEPLAPRAEVTARQQQILDFIAAYTDEHGYPPSLREIGRGVGLKSVDAVRYQLGQLAERELVELPSVAHQRRSLRLIKGGA